MVIAFLHRHLMAAGAYLGVLVLAGFVGAGFALGWDAQGWGALAALFAGLITFGAVAVALREATQGRRDRLVDYEAARRRECVQALGDLWGAIMQVGLEAQTFEFYLDELPGRFNPNFPRGASIPDQLRGTPMADEFAERLHRLLDRWVTAVEPHIFITHSLLDDTPLKEAINDLQRDLDALNNKVLPAISKTFLSGHRPDVQSFKDAWKTLVTRRQAHLDLAREHFGLSLEDVQAAALGQGRHAPRAVMAQHPHEEPTTSPEPDPAPGSMQDRPAL